MNLFNRKSKVTSEKKQSSHSEEVKNSPRYVSFLFSTFGEGIGQEFLPPHVAYGFYNKLAPVQSTVAKIARAVGNLPLVLRDEEYTSEIRKDADILTLLNHPSKLTTKKQFLTNCALSLMLTRELWLVARGFRNRPPEELVFVHPYNVQIIEDPEHQWPSKIYVNINGDRRYYSREPAPGGRFRYFDQTGLNEIFPYISERSVSGNSGYFRGTSPLLSIKDELLSYSSSVLANTSTIENAGRPSGILSPKDDNITEKQYDDLIESMETVAGARNSGKIIVLPTSVESAFPQWAPKDMDFPELQKNVKASVWSLYYIPFPMVSEQSQSHNNTETAETSFYDNAVDAVFSDVSDALKWSLET
jgi:HK97 family phage portal protein